MPCVPPYLGRVATTSLRRPTVASHPPSTVTSRPGTLPDESCANAVTTRIHAGRRGAAGRSVAEERRSSRKRIRRLRYDPQSGGDPSDVSREPAVPSTWRGVEDRSRRACAGVGSGLVPLCLPRPSLSGPQRGEEESGKFNANNDLDAPDRGWRRVLVTYIANRCCRRCINPRTCPTRARNTASQSAPLFHKFLPYSPRSGQFESRCPTGSATENEGSTSPNLS